MKLADLNTSRYLTKSDVEDPVVVTVVSITKENVAQNGQPREDKGVLRFDEFGDRGLVLNAVNRDLVAELLGREPDRWVGGKLELYVDPTVVFNNKRIGGIRVRAPETKKVKAVKSKPVVNNEPPPDESMPPFEDDVDETAHL